MCVPGRVSSGCPFKVTDPPSSMAMSMRSTCTAVSGPPAPPGMPTGQRALELDPVDVQLERRRAVGHGHRVRDRVEVVARAGVARGQRVWTWSAHEQGVLCIAFGRRGELVSVGRDHNVCSWDPTGSLLDTLKPAFSDVATRVAFFGEVERVVAGDWTGRLRIWPARETTGQNLFP